MPSEQLKFAAFLSTYQRPAALESTIQQILQQSRIPDHILIVDNGNSEETRKVLSKYSGKLMTYHAMEENTGPAGASAYGFHRLAGEGYDWIYWGDDDDPPEFPDVFERLLKIAESASQDIAGVGAVGALFDWQKGLSKRLPDRALNGIVDVDTIGGNSQFILRREAILSVGVPNPQLFFGYYEPEYCLRLRKAGYRLVVDGNLMWKYREKKGRLEFKRHRKLVSDYPYDMIWRRYYRTRNYIYMMRNTFRRADLARREMFRALLRALFSWARGPAYAIHFTKLQLRGIWDGYRARMGRTVVSVPKIES